MIQKLIFQRNKPKEKKFLRKIKSPVEQNFMKREILLGVMYDEHKESILKNIFDPIVIRPWLL